jgi:hypothetical protein
VPEQEPERNRRVQLKQPGSAIWLSCSNLGHSNYWPQDYLPALNRINQKRRGSRRKHTGGCEFVPALYTQTKRPPSPRVREKAPVAKLAKFPMVTIVRDKSLVLRINGGQSVTLVARRVEAENRSDIPTAAYEALWEPTFKALVAHRVCVVAERRASPTAAGDVGGAHKQ